MAIVPLPQFEADVAEYEAERDKEIYERLKPPTTIVVRFGFMKMIGEFPYSGDAKPGCGSKIVVRSFRGTEIGEMLTSTCPNAGCSKSVTRKEMLEYIENSGGRDYPFERNGRAIRVATKEDMDAQAAIEQGKHELKMEAREIADRLRLPIKIVEAEPIIGGERTTFYGMSEDRIDPRKLIAGLEELCGTKVDLRQVGARDEARLTADYERCGQYCCCKNFLKVLKPISMRSAKVQKATLDPLKISGRCGRLMCCLRYEDQTYEELRKRLPKRKTTVGTPEGDGLVVDTQILTQLVLVELDATRKRIAVREQAGFMHTSPPPDHLLDQPASHLPIQPGTHRPPGANPTNGPAPRPEPTTASRPTRASRPRSASAAGVAPRSRPMAKAEHPIARARPPTADPTRDRTPKPAAANEAMIARVIAKARARADRRRSVAGVAGAPAARVTVRAVARAVKVRVEARAIVQAAGPPATRLPTRELQGIGPRQGTALWQASPPSRSKKP